MRTKLFLFRQECEAIAFLKGVQYVNDSAIELKFSEFSSLGDDISKYSSLPDYPARLKEGGVTAAAALYYVDDEGFFEDDEQYLLDNDNDEGCDPERPNHTTIVEFVDCQL